VRYLCDSINRVAIWRTKKKMMLQFQSKKCHPM